MRKSLMNSVAIAALSVSVAGAMAQERRNEPASGSPAAQSEGQRGNAPARNEGRGEERSQQGQRASEGAGREGAGRNASERGQERGERAQPSTAQQRDQGRDQNREQSSQDRSQERSQDRANTPSTSAQQQQQQRDQDQQGGATTRSTSSDRDRDQQQQRPAPTNAQQNERNQSPQSQPSSQRSTDQQRQQGTQGAQQDFDRNREGAAATNTSGDRSGRGQTNVQVRGEFNLDQQAATRVHDRLIRDRDARASDININVDVGRNLPNNVRLRPVPREIVEINPRYREYDYVVVRDEIVIVEPRTRRVVQIISSDGSHGGARMVRLDNRQRDMVRRDIMRSRTASRRDQDFNFDLREGVEIPDRVALQRFPEEVWREVPDLRDIRYIIVRDDIVLVDPGTREIIEIIR